MCPDLALSGEWPTPDHERSGVVQADSWFLRLLGPNETRIFHAAKKRRWRGLAHAPMRCSVRISSDFTGDVSSFGGLCACSFDEGSLCVENKSNGWFVRVRHVFCKLSRTPERHRSVRAIMNTPRYKNIRHACKNHPLEKQFVEMKRNCHVPLSRCRSSSLSSD